MRPPGGQESSERPLHNGLSDDSTSETSGYSESSGSNNTLVSLIPEDSATAHSQKQWDFHFIIIDD